jgi:damage-control phosphatase, subfamily I
MKTRERCFTCLQDFAWQIVSLSKANGVLAERCFHLIDLLYSPSKNPTEISNQLLKFIRGETGVADPFATKKAMEFRQAREAAEKFRRLFSADLEGLLKYSCLGNSHDYFEGSYNVSDFHFLCDVESIQERIKSAGSKVLLFGDNVGDFFFDLPLIRFLESSGKDVYYAVKEAPAQNDLSMPDVDLYGLRDLFANIISTGADEVGVRRERMTGTIKDLWEGDALVIAKGMANYEAISEFHDERSVLYILKVKCKTVAETLGRNVGEHTSFIGGVYGS